MDNIGVKLTIFCRRTVIALEKKRETRLPFAVNVTVNLSNL